MCVFGVPVLCSAPAWPAPQTAAVPDQHDRVTLIVTVSATPRQAAVRLRQILVNSGKALTVYVYPTSKPGAGPSCCQSSHGPNDTLADPLQFVFPDLEVGEYALTVQVGKYKRPPPRTFQLRKDQQHETYEIAFRELIVRAEPTFALYLADYRDRLRASRGAKRSADDSFVLCADSEGVQFFFWDLAVFSAVLTATGAGEALETEPLDVPMARALSTPYKIAVPDERLERSPFDAVTFQRAVKQAGCAP